MKSCFTCTYSREISGEHCLSCAAAFRADKSIPFPNWQPQATVQKADTVEHPSHYKGAKYECIEVMQEVFGIEAAKDFCLLNAFKYLWRCNKKHADALTDVKKARFYIEKHIELTEGAENDGKKEDDASRARA